MNIRIILAAAAATILAGCSSLKDGEYNLSIVTTGDGSVPGSPNHFPIKAPQEVL